ncbi:hypothetical protein [Bosea thiooxidans]
MSLVEQDSRRASPVPSPRAFAIGDALLSPPLYSPQTEASSIVSYHSASTLTWLRTLLPGLALADSDIAGHAQTNTVRLAAGIAEIAAARAGYELALISVGSVDCEETTRGVAPAPATGVTAIEHIVGTLLRAAIRPVLLLPPPHPLFANGLFADRFISISATLRRLARQFPEIVLVDPTAKLKRRDGFGIEPQPELVEADGSGRPTIAGAFVLAELIADRLVAALPACDLAQPGVPDGIPLLAPAAGGTAGEPPEGFSLETEHAGGIAARLRPAVAPDGRPGLRIEAGGRYASPWPFLRINRDLPPSRLEGLGAGSEITASAEIAIAHAAQGLASVSLQLTPVWRDGYVGASSSEFYGQRQIGSGRIRLLRTPTVRLPGPLQRLTLSLMLHFLPGTERIADGAVDVFSVRFSRSSPGAP